MKRILLTGSNGRLGRKVAQALSESGYPQIHLTSKEPENKWSGVEYIHADWQNLQIPSLIDVDVVIHLAHQTSAYQARKDVEADIRSNLISTVRIVESLSKSVNPIHFIYMGSLTQYGSMIPNPIRESDQNLNPETFYDCSKMAVELYLKQFQQEKVLDSLTFIRLGNLYGFTEDSKKLHRGFFDDAIFSAFEGSEVTCFGDGSFVRDFIHVDDLVTALFGFIEAPRGAVDGTFNLAGGTGYTLNEALELIGHSLISLGRDSIQVKNKDFPIDSYAIEKRSHIADISLVKKIIGWTPRISLAEGISRSINYYSLIGTKSD
jgi:nucleoside-diphosphate-sugar epimerase